MNTLPQEQARTSSPAEWDLGGTPATPDLIEMSNDSSIVREIYYSYNPKITPNMSKEEGGKQTTGWIFESRKWSEPSITDMIRSHSYIPSKLKGGIKSKVNVEEVYNIVLDFDLGTPTWGEMVEKVKKFRFSCVLHTTVSHQKPKTDESTGIEVPDSVKDRYRLWIPLSKPISNTEYIGLKDYYLKIFPTIDKSSFEGSRYFKVNPDAQVYFHNSTKDAYGNNTELEFLDLVKEKILSVSPQNNSIGRPKTLKTNGDFSINDSVTLYDGTKVLYREITEKVRIICPFCNPAERQHPNTHNAFVDFNAAGQMYLYCSSEDTTYWSHPNELVSERSLLFFNETVGYASRIIPEGGYVVFKNNDDWQNYCYNNKIKPECKIFLPRVRIIFNPAMASGLQLKDGYFNMFEESEYLKNHDTTQPLFSGDDVLIQMEQQTPVIYELMMNIFGMKDYLKRFLNWNAVILKRRIKVDTAWLITSKEQGIGKGLMFDRILQPLFGNRQSILENGQRMGKNFNSLDQTQWLKVYDEVYLPGNPKENLARKEWLKYIITAREQTIELKGIDCFTMANHMNLILYSNNECPIFLDNNDRRFNVIRNENAVKTEKLSFYKDIPDMQNRIDEELPKFAELLLSFDFDVELANKAVDSTAKDKLQEIAADEYEEFVNALKAKDDSHFLLREIFPPSQNEMMFAHVFPLSSEGSEVESAIKNGYIPAKSMSKVCKFHFQGHYKTILSRLKLKGLEKLTKKIGGDPIAVYIVR